MKKKFLIVALSIVAASCAFVACGEDSLGELIPEGSDSTSEYVMQERNVSYVGVIDGVIGEIPANMKDSAGAYPTKYMEGEGVEVDSLINAGQYAFDGWYTDEACGNLFSEIDGDTRGDITLYAKISTLKYTVSYKAVLDGEVCEIPEQMWNSDGSYPTEYTYSIGATVSTLLDYEVDSQTVYTFEGWYMSEDCFAPVSNIGTGVTGNITLYAKIEVNATGADIEYKMVSHFGVSDTVNANMYANGGNYPDEYEYGVETEISDLVEYQTASGRYAFGGWYLDEACTLEFGGITENTRGKLTLYAKVDAYMSIAYKAVIDGTVGEVPADMGADALAEEYLVGGTLTLQELTETANKDFLGWYEDEACNTPFVGTGKVSAFTAYAKIQTKAGVTYYAVKDGQQVALEGAWKKTDGAYPTEYNYGADTVVDGLQETFVIEGTTYKFVGWYTDATCSVAFKGITAQSRGAITLYAKIDQVYAISYFVVYKGETRAMSKISGVPTWYTKGMSVTVPNKTYYEETYREYTLTGVWYTDEACTQEFKGISATQTGDLKLYAKATKMDAWTPPF